MVSPEVSTQESPPAASDSSSSVFEPHAVSTMAAAMSIAAPA